jgi:hypothetical protein
MILPAVQFALAGSYSQTFVIPISDTWPDAHWYEFSAVLTVPIGATGWQNFDIIGLYNNVSYKSYYIDNVSLIRLDSSCGC